MPDEPSVVMWAVLYIKCGQFSAQLECSDSVVASGALVYLFSGGVATKKLTLLPKICNLGSIFLMYFDFPQLSFPVIRTAFTTLYQFISSH